MTTKYKGILVNLGDRRLVAPPLNFKSLQALQGRLAQFKEGDLSPEALNTIVEATYLSLQRNYPDITRDEVVDGLDLENMMDLMSAVTDISGLRRKAMAQDAEGNGDPSTGTSSTPT